MSNALMGNSDPPVLGSGRRRSPAVSRSTNGSANRGAQAVPSGVSKQLMAPKEINPESRRRARINLRTTEAMQRSIAAAAQAGGITESSLIERIVRKYLEDAGFGLWVPLPLNQHAQLREIGRQRKQPPWKIASLLIGHALREANQVLPPDAEDCDPPDPTDDAAR